MPRADDTCKAEMAVYRLAETGSYSAFARSSGPVYLEARGPSGELLVASPSSTATAAVFDLPTAIRFGVPAPPVFEVRSHVDLHVDSTAAPYELVLVRFGDADGWSGFDLRPPVTVEPAALRHCGADNGPKVRTVHLDAMYSDVTARQVFVISADG